MRITLAIAIVAAIALAAWWNQPTFARQAAASSIDPTHMMMTVTELPTQQYVAY